MITPTAVALWNICGYEGMEFTKTALTFTMEKYFLFEPTLDNGADNILISKDEWYSEEFQKSLGERNGLVY